jgi:electron transfer flavoprotein alpha subunit
VLTLEDAALASYTPDAQVAAVAGAIAQTTPRLVVMAHTYQARDYAPRWPRACARRSWPTSSA